MMPMLRQVARAYLSHHSLDEISRFCFVFPNKRSATFFLRYLDMEAGCPHLEPEVTTISDFVATFSPLAEAPRYMQAATLYDAYRQVAADEIESFDRFLYWGETLLADFAEVDRYLVDTERLFTNVRELREIKSTYLTDVQRDIIRRFRGLDDDTLDGYLRVGEEGESDTQERFWTHLDSLGHQLTDDYSALWQLLLKVYNLFNRLLADDGFSTSGQHYRNAAERLRLEDVSTLPLLADRYIFVGFNMLSTSEIEIFDRLRRAGRADFYWDVASPAFRIPGCNVGEMARRGAEMFPSLYETEDDGESAMPEIEIIGVPSAVGQVKVASHRLLEWQTNNFIGDGSGELSGVDTAVVLADEKMLMPLMSHVPASLPAINITMGFPMKLTPVATVIHTAVLLQRRQREVDGHPAYFYEDVVELLNQPIVRAMAPKAVDDLLMEIRSERRITLDVAYLRSAYPALSPLFVPLDSGGGSSLEHCRDYFTGLLDLFSLYATEESSPVERRFLEAYRLALDELVAAFTHRDITMNTLTMATIIEHSLSTATVSFTGEPLEGVQVMGVLETRALDFDNIVMLSLNEDIFPRRHSRPSFILETLRPAFGLPGREVDQIVTGYYFYRLLTRARRVTLLYDARTVGTDKIGEMSRYLSQLLYLFPDAKIIHRAAQFDLSGPRERTGLSVAKTGDVATALKEYLRPGSGKRLSASALNNYINCPLMFYLSDIRGLRFETETDGEDFMDAATYGSVVHYVLQKLYEELAARSAGGVISRETLMAAGADFPMVSRYTTAAINRLYLRKVKGKDAPECYDPLTGTEDILGRIITELVCRLLRLEGDTFGCIPFVGAEVELDGQIEVVSGLKVNIRQIIDRVDRAGADGSLRFVDFKTGNDPTQYKSVESAFDFEDKDRPKVLFQLLFYCYCYSRLEGYEGPIQPYVYPINRLFTDSLKPLTFKVARIEEPITDYRPYMPEFEERLQALVSEIFNLDIPFEAAVNRPDYDGHCCKFCRFKAICDPPEK